jgi:hypothetical protein
MKSLLVVLFFLSLTVSVDAQVSQRRKTKIYEIYTTSAKVYVDTLKEGSSENTMSLRMYINAIFLNERFFFGYTCTNRFYCPEMDFRVYYNDK